MAEYNKVTYERMLREAERRGENVVFVLIENTAYQLGGVDVYKLPVPGVLDREKHWCCWFMHLPQFHGEINADPTHHRAGAGTTG